MFKAIFDPKVIGAAAVAIAGVRKAKEISKEITFEGDIQLRGHISSKTSTQPEPQVLPQPSQKP